MLAVDMGDIILLEDLELPSAGNLTTVQKAQEIQSTQLNGHSSSHTNYGATVTDILQEPSLVTKTVDFFKTRFLYHEIEVNSESVETRLTRRERHKNTKNTKKIKGDGLSLTPFHTALVKGDIAFVKHLLEQLSPELKTQVLNAVVDYSQPTAFQKDLLEEKLKDCPTIYKETIRSHFKVVQACDHPFSDLQQGLPLSLAILSGDVSMVKLLLDNGADVFKADYKGNNCIHNLVFLSKRHTKHAIKMYCYLMQQLPSADDKRTLVLAKNLDDHQPLDVAFREASPEFSLALLNTDRVYRFPLRDYGAFQHVLYDITEYETQDSRKLHLFSYLALTREKDLENIRTSDLLEREPIKTWMKVKGESVNHLTWAWVIMWMLYIAIYLTSLGLFFLKDGSRPPMAYSVVLLISSSGALVSEIVNMGVELKLYNVMRKNGPPIAFSPAYRIFHGCFAASLIVTESLHLAKLPCEDHRELFVSLYVMNAVFSLSSLLVFTQINRHTGHLVIIIDRMMGDVALFTTVAGIIFFSFCFSFYLLHAPPVCHDVNNTLDWNRTTLMFSTLIQTVYETQLLSLGLMAPLALYFQDSNIPLLGMLLYVAFLIMLVIVLLNLLIAIMSDRVNELNKYKHIVIEIQRIALTMSMDSKIVISKLCGMGRFNFFGHIKDHILKKHTLRNNQNGRLYLHVIESISNREGHFLESDLLTNKGSRRRSTLTLR